MTDQEIASEAQSLIKRLNELSKIAAKQNIKIFVSQRIGISDILLSVNKTENLLCTA